MKLHTDLGRDSIWLALGRAKDAGKVTSDIEFAVFSDHKSQTRKFSYEIQLGTLNKHSGPTKSRRYKNSGQYGAGNIWAATYEEWGWFIAEVFAADPDALFGPYKGIESFNSQTKNQFVLPFPVPDQVAHVPPYQRGNLPSHYDRSVSELDAGL